MSAPTEPRHPDAALAELHRLLRDLGATLATRDPDTLPSPDQRVPPRPGSRGFYETGALLWHPIDRWRVIVPADASRDVFVANPFETVPTDGTAFTPADARALGQALIAAADWATNDLWRRRYRLDAQDGRHG
jgi:hypothetical protein